MNRFLRKVPIILFLGLATPAIYQAYKNDKAETTSNSPPLLQPIIQYENNQMITTNSNTFNLGVSVYSIGSQTFATLSSGGKTSIPIEIECSVEAKSTQIENKVNSNEPSENKNNYEMNYDVNYDANNDEASSNPLLNKYVMKIVSTTGHLFTNFKGLLIKATSNRFTNSINKFESSNNDSTATLEISFFSSPTEKLLTLEAEVQSVYLFEGFFDKCYQHLLAFKTVLSDHFAPVANAIIYELIRFYKTAKDVVNYLTPKFLTYLKYLYLSHKYVFCASVRGIYSIMKTIFIFSYTYPQKGASVVTAFVVDHYTNFILPQSNAHKQGLIIFSITLFVTIILYARGIIPCLFVWFRRQLSSLGAKCSKPVRFLFKGLVQIIRKRTSPPLSDDANSPNCKKPSRKPFVDKEGWSHPSKVKTANPKKSKKTKRTPSDSKSKKSSKSNGIINLTLTDSTNSKATVKPISQKKLKRARGIENDLSMSSSSSVHSTASPASSINSEFQDKLKGYNMFNLLEDDCED